jgi:hypothetical protein
MKRLLFVLMLLTSVPAFAQSNYVLDSTLDVGREFDAPEGQFTLFYTPGLELGLPKAGVTFGATFHFDAFNNDLERIHLLVRVDHRFSARWTANFVVENIGYRVNYFDPHAGVSLQFPRGLQRFNDWRIGTQIRYRIKP